MFNARCQICGTPFRSKRFKWKIRGQTAWVCPNCNSKLDRRVSSAAFGAEVDFPPVLKNGCGCGSMLVIGLVALVGIGMFKSCNEKTFVPVADIPPPPSPAYVPTRDKPKSPPKPAPKIPLFHDPEKAIQTVFDLGLTNSSGEKAKWEKTERGWSSLSKKLDPRSESAKVTDLGNGLICVHSSSREERIETVTWTIRTAGSSPQIPAVFQESCLAYCSKLGTSIPPELFKSPDPSGEQHLITFDATFELMKLDAELGKGWTLTIKEKPSR